MCPPSPHSGACLRLLTPMAMPPPRAGCLAR
jgi:hypothetical protein